jgi:hypothetical protein
MKDYPGSADLHGAERSRLGQIVAENGLQGVSKKEAKEVIAYIKKNAKNVTACQHLISIHKRVPHPKYGDKVPHFETVEVPDPMLCPCEEARAFRESLGD